MIWTILITAPLLIGVYVACYRAHPIACAPLILLFYFTTLCVGAASSWLALIYLAIIPLFILCRWLGASRPKFAGASAAMVVIVVGISIVAFIPRWHEIQALDHDYPRQRIDKLLAYEARNLADNTSTSNRTKAMEREDFRLLTESLDGGGLFRGKNNNAPWVYRHREASLQKLEEIHQNFAQAFAAQDGFGAVRRIRIPATEEYIRLPKLQALTLPESPKSAVSAAEAEPPETPVNPSDDIKQWHAQSVANFANTPGFGYFVEHFGDYGSSNNHDDPIWVRGFDSHGFQSLPAESPIGEDWQLIRLDLVSLLKHAPPAAYISESLPRMEELSSDNFPTRGLDKFEKPALERLQRGETIIVQRSRNRVRMLGALLAAKQCIQCHNVAQGDVLGAFTYEFLRKEPLPLKKDPEKPAPPLT